MNKNERLLVLELLEITRQALDYELQSDYWKECHRDVKRIKKKLQLQGGVE